MKASITVKMRVLIHIDMNGSGLNAINCCELFPSLAEAA